MYSMYTVFAYIVHLLSAGKNVGGNSRNSRPQVWTYKISDGTSASAYVLCPFQALVPRFWNRGTEVGGTENGGKIRVVLGVGFRE